MKIRKQTPAGAVLAGVILVLSLALVPAAFAGKSGGGSTHGGGGGGGGGGSTVSAPVMVTDTGTPGLSWGDSITFNVSTSASWPSVQLDCYQGGALVYTATRGFYATYMWSDNYPLENQYWTSGAANCVATLYNTNKNGSSTTLATKPFSVGA